jgi:hypothetical protein
MATLNAMDRAACITELLDLTDYRPRWRTVRETVLNHVMVFFEAGEMPEIRGKSDSGRGAAISDLRKHWAKLPLFLHMASAPQNRFAITPADLPAFR